jgi:hypothetical protein
MTRFAFTSGTCVAVLKHPVSWKTVSSLRNSDTRGSRDVNRSNAACPISIHMPLALMN